MDLQRNTPEAPTLDHCTTCGANENDGNGNVRLLHGHLTCKRCRNGAQQLVKHEPHNYRFGVDGRLEFIGERDKVHVERENDGIRLYYLIKEAVEGLDVNVEEPQPTHGLTAIVLPSRYRWHIYPGHMDPTGDGRYTFRLFSPSREMIRPDIFFGRFAPARIDVQRQIRDLVQDSLTGDVAGLLEQHELQEITIRAEIDALTPLRIIEGTAL